MAGDGPRGAGVTCPSAAAVPGAALHGVVGGDGRVRFLGTPIPVDTEFLDRVGAEPTRRYRFVAPCAEGACAQWTGSRCGVADRAVEVLGGEPGALRACAIRSTCRWYAQRGRAACAVCDEVVTLAG